MCPRTSGRGRGGHSRSRSSSPRCDRLRDETDDERDTVELIFFPTGGGKTEAYLGLAAFSIFYRRLTDPDDTGVDVLMRYTLRLLTAQQFQRASALICAMEHLARGETDARGDAEFSIGIWLGGVVTPNNRTDARQRSRQLNRAATGRRTSSSFSDALGALRRWDRSINRPTPRARRQDASRRSQATTRRGDTVVFSCPDSSCEFHQRLPVYVIDEDIYERRPSLVIGTVDKFAMLALAARGARRSSASVRTAPRSVSPPNLIIQDELHLISGPLGSMVGLYETADRGAVHRPARRASRKPEDRQLDGDDPPVRAADPGSLRRERTSPCSRRAGSTPATRSSPATRADDDGTLLPGPHLRRRPRARASGRSRPRRSAPSLRCSRRPRCCSSRRARSVVDARWSSSTASASSERRSRCCSRTSPTTSGSCASASASRPRTSARCGTCSS